MLLTTAATRRPLLIIVDDTQWLDQESADALGFLARRLYADRICLLVAMRDPTEERHHFDGLPSLALAPLSEAASVALLDTAVEGRLADQVRGRLLADAGGNPLALVEFSRELSPDQLAGAEPSRSCSRWTGGSKGPSDGRWPRSRSDPDAPAVAATEPTGDDGLIWRVGCDLGFDEGVVPGPRRPACSGPDQSSFRYPLIRSAVYQGASPADRRRAHEALAAASDAERDPDKRAWHRAAAAQFPDADVAADLERAAHRAASRGSCAASARLAPRS